MDSFIHLIQAAPVAMFWFLITLLTSIYALFVNESVISQYIFYPYRIVRYNEYWRFISGALIHANFMHLFFNLFTFYNFGLLLEIQTLGHTGFALVYLGSMLIADIPSFVKHKNNPRFMSLGASGAIAGLLFSFICFYPLETIYVFFFPMPAILFGALYLGYTHYASRNVNDGINHDAHLWGALAGIFITIALHPDVILRFL
ncbi:MAG: rhomboid family intramembrane serine protease [Bacteroidia bacterium]|nr:rhomboid family intramembrane serine protease [Bacteroidia bacterium]